MCRSHPSFVLVVACQCGPKKKLGGSGAAGDDVAAGAGTGAVVAAVVLVVARHVEAIAVEEMGW